jgi:hypothetical protein
MRLLQQLDEAAIMWNKTKNPIYKDLWYSLLKKFKVYYQK